MQIKQRLVSLGYLYAATKNLFGNDTYKAVKAFQTANGLEADGIVGVLTWAALFPTSSEVSTVEAVILPERFSQNARRAIGIELAQVSEIRREICLDALQFAVEATEKPASMLSFYIRGGNLYGKDLTLNVMTEAKLQSYFRKADYSPYFDGGRDDLMMETARAAGFSLAGCDCSGGVVGLWRKHGVVSPGFDANANSLGAGCVKTTTPQAGDLACRSGHVGVYVGGGYVVEWVGGAYGCQLTNKNDRRVFNFQDRKLHKFSAWDFFGDPKGY